tara:strand:+ start:266 stop:511 length:246 start_codon:yes stop_codon:yes gene_type:complete
MNISADKIAGSLANGGNSMVIIKSPFFSPHIIVISDDVVCTYTSESEFMAGKKPNSETIINIFQEKSDDEVIKEQLPFMII